MIFSAGFVIALAILIAVSGSVTRTILATWLRRGEGGASASSRLARMEERIQRIEEATSGIVAEFAAVRERERFMTQLVESRARKDARAAEVPAPVASPAAPTDASPFVVQTVSAVRRSGVPRGQA